MTKTVSLAVFSTQPIFLHPEILKNPQIWSKDPGKWAAESEKPGPKIQNHGLSPGFWISSHLSPFSKTMMKQCATKEIHSCLACCHTIAGLCRKTLELRRCSRWETQCRLNGGRETGRSLFNTAMPGTLDGSDLRFPLSLLLFFFSDTNDQNVERGHARHDNNPKARSNG